MLIDGGLAPRTTNVAVAALRLLYDSVLGQPEKVAALRFRRVPHRLPRTMPEEDVEHLIQAMTDMRYRMATLVDYGSALRVCEVVSRQIQDIRRGVPEQAKRPVRSGPPGRRHIAARTGSRNAVSPGQWLFERKAGIALGHERMGQHAVAPVEDEARAGAALATLADLG